MEFRYDINNLKEVAKSLINVLKVIPKDNLLETMIDMMENDMTFDDPGLFLRQPVKDETEKIIQEGAVLWLIHQLMYVVSCEQYVKSKLKTLHFQKRLLSASYIKQHWLFLKLVDRYAEFSHQLVHVDRSLKEPFIVTTFQFDKFKEISLIPTDYPSRVISIRNLSTLHYFTMANVKILTHAISLLVNSHEVLVRRCTDAVLQTFDVMDFHIKMLALQFLLEETVHQNSDYCRAVIQLLLQCFDSINTRIDQWNVAENVNDFDETLTQFLCDDCIHSKFCEKTDDCAKIFDFCLALLERRREIRGSHYEHLIESAHRRLCSILKKHISPSLIRKVDDYISNMQSLSKYSLALLEYCVLEECRYADGMYNWVFGCEMAEKILGQCDRAERTDNVSENLNLFNYLLEMCLRVRHNFIAWHQIQHLNLTNDSDCKICTITHDSKHQQFILGNRTTTINMVHPTILGNISTLSHRFVNIVKKKKCLMRLDVSSAAVSLLSFCDPNDPTSDIRDLLALTMCIYDFYNVVETFRSEFVNSTIARVDKINILRRLLHHEIHLNPDILNAIQRMVFAEKFLSDLYIILLVRRAFNRTELLQNLFDGYLNDPALESVLSENMLSLICLTLHNCNASICSVDNDYQYSVSCNACNGDNLNETTTRIMLPITVTQNDALSDEHLECILRLMQSDQLTVRLNIVKCLPAICHNHSHVLCATKNLFWTNIFNDGELAKNLKFLKIIPRIVNGINNSNLSQTLKDRTMQTCLEILLVAATQSLQTSDKARQSAVVAVVGKFASSETITERLLLLCYRMMLFFLVNPKSLVVGNAILCASTMCQQKGILTKNLYIWYKEQILSTVIRLAVSVYLEYGLMFDKTLANFNEMLGYTHLKRDLMKNDFAIITAMVLPYALQYPTCQELLQSICALTNLHLDLLFARSFIQIYVYLHLRQPPDVTENCLKFISEKTGKTVNYFLNVDPKRSLSEVLLSYHKKPEFAAQTIRILMSKESTTIKNVSIDRITHHLATRFLGVLNSFGTILMTNNFEKVFQRDALRSLGEIIRFIGPKDITPYRFKILELLHSVGNLDVKELTDICVSVWKIFIYTVDISKLGPLLSTILVLLEPLLKSHATEVNEILKFLIISNGSLINRFISDLFFLEVTPVCDEIKNYVAEHSQRLLIDDTFEKKFKLYSKQINHENVANVGVRIYGLNYLSDLFCQHRNELNDLILGQQRIHPLIENLLENLMEGSKHVDEKLQIASAICLGHLGAIEPSLLPRNYAPESCFALSIHTDTFSIMALDQLLKAYQSQKNTHLVNAFSLAIQELFVARGVDPKQKKKMEIWNSIPEKMRPLMEPFLTSCYTALNSNVITNIHPIFGSADCSTIEYWAFHWSLNMMNMITDDQTKKLFTSFKASMRHHTGILLMFLPYVLVHSLQNATDGNVEKIKEEFMCVFDAVSNSADGLSLKCAKIATGQLDFLERWICHYENASMSKRTQEYLRIRDFSAQFSPQLLAQVNFRCGEYAKALMSLEQHLLNDPSKLQSELTFLLQIYAELLDVDSMEGTLKLKDKQPTSAEQILLNNMTGRLQDSTVVFENKMQIGDITEANVTDIVQCYLGLDQPETALRMTESLMKQFYDKNIDSLLIGKAEPLWRLGRFEELESLLENDNIRASQNWGVQCGQVLLKFTKGKFDEYPTALNNCRLSVLKEFHSTSDGKSDYNTRYPVVLKLHLITEMESVQEMLNEFSCQQDVDSSTQVLNVLFDLWNARLEILQPTARIIEPVLCLRRILLTECKQLFTAHIRNEPVLRNGIKMIDKYIGTSLMKSIELARNAEMYQQAQLFILNAETYSPPDLFIEKTKLHWVKGDQAACFNILGRGIEEMEKSGAKELYPSIYGEAKFLFADYTAESKKSNPNKIQDLYKLAIHELKSSEKCLVHLAQYQDQIFAAMSDSEKHSKPGYELQQEIMTQYGKSMMFGCEYVFQSMPRFLSIWLDFYKYNKSDSHKPVAENLNLVVERFSERLPAFVFFTAFSQLVSRVSHPINEVYQVVKTIIIKLITQFPQRSLWMILMVYKSSYTNRVRRCSEIFSDKRLASKPIQKLIQDFNSLAELFITLTNYETQKSVDKLSVATICSALPKLLHDTTRSPILFPSEKLMNPVLPAPSVREKLHTYNAFPHDDVYIHDIRDDIYVFASLQRPKRITLVGSDGKSYMMMMKAKDDLRKDFRLMEFNAVVKQYLRQDSDSRQRRLYIRTYAVIPLNEECGIIEWIPDLDAFRSIIHRIMKRKNVMPSNRELKVAICAKNDPIEKKRAAFLDVLLPNHPPVFRDWFVEKFTTPHNWYQARSSFIRTTAVMSMVGYILGLGDRHGENILLDATNGDIIHVDFNCLFNRGEQFEYPELVPFRLTHNMVHAMGPLGVEGMFRKCCEIALKVLRQQMPILMSVLKPFVYDPLVEWNKKTTSNANKTMERIDPHAMSNVNRIEERLKGLIKTDIRRSVSNIPLSVEGVVDHCISQATDIDRLAAMFYGWASFL
ncbi:hypothetical protein HA402_013811 [Bradysia odoriphaga]|nr:hypothetical protein HA402_013811 [Bradysia odoriphaga]